MTTATPSKPISPEYLSCAETANLIRAALKQRFPSVRFSVRSKMYAGGAPINVRWTDGPTVHQVEGVTKHFEGGRFDGMIDLGYSVTHWLTDGGTATLAHDPDTLGSASANPERSNPIPPTPGARLVHLGADYVFCSRSLSSDEALRTESERLAAAYDYGPVTAWRILSAIDFLAGDTIQDAYRKVVQNRDTV